MNKRDEQLLTILAKSDAVFWPLRRRQGAANTVFYERRRDFLITGVPWASGAVSEAGRKAAQRDLEALSAAGLVKPHNPRGGRTVGVRLTESADDATRRKIGLATYADSLPFLDELYRRLADGDGCDFLGWPWTSEQSLTGVQWGDDANRGYYVLLTEDLYPLLWRGLVRSNASVQGHVWYGLSADGSELAHERAESGQASKDYPPPPPAEGDAEAFDFYHDMRMEEVKAIENAKPKDSREIGEIPMPVCPLLREYEQARRSPQGGSR